jgi:ubiquinone biosynthesis protein UbiJ
MQHPFLSEDWISAAREIRARYADQAPTTSASVRVNLNISEVPFGEGNVPAHLDTSSGRLEMELGHLDEADATVTTDYATAKNLVVYQDQGALMQAFMGGKVKIQGDGTKLMALAAAGQTNSTSPDAGILAGKIADEIKAITQ